MNLKHQQRGLSAMALLFLIIILVLLLIMFFKLFPLYMDNMKVADALEQLKEEDNIVQKVDAQIRRTFLNKLSNKNVSLFSDEELKQHLIISRRTEENAIDLELNYERTNKFIGNVFFLVKFEHQIEIP